MRTHAACKNNFLNFFFFFTQEFFSYTVLVLPLCTVADYITVDFTALRSTESGECVYRFRHLAERGKKKMSRRNS